MSSSRRWTRIAITGLTALAAMAALQGIALLVLGLRAALPLAVLAPAALAPAALALAAAGAGGRAAMFLRRGHQARAARWSAAWAALVLAAVGVVGATFAGGRLFW